LEAAITIALKIQTHINDISTDQHLIIVSESKLVNNHRKFIWTLKTFPKL